MLLFAYELQFYEKLFEENLDAIALFCMIVSLLRVAFPDFLSTAIIIAKKEVSTCLLQ